MLRARMRHLTGSVVSLFIVAGCVTTARGGSSGGLPTCINAQTCAPSGGGVCTSETLPSFVGPTVVSDFPDGLSSDGRGPYTPGTDGVLGSGVSTGAGMGLTRPRALTLNLNHPVPGGGGIPLGIVTFANNELPQWGGLLAQWRRVGNGQQNLHDIPVGETATAAQINVLLHIDGRFHLLQIGPQPFGHCHAGASLVSGAGTSAGTVFRASATKWVVDLPAGSMGRLFDLSTTAAHAVDRGLYYVHLHYEVGN
jgi:hypothetical protein